MSPDRLSSTFAALADPTRRAILARLASGETSVTDLAKPFDISLPAVSRHLKVLELQPAKRVLWQVVDGPQEWIGTKISFDLKQAGDHAIVLFKHQDWKEPVEFMHHCSTKWAIYLMSLKSLVETRKGSPNPNDTHISGDGPD